MKTLEQIRRQLFVGEFDFSRHALKRAVEGISLMAKLLERQKMLN